jgi:hypothetical protein
MPYTIGAYRPLIVLPETFCTAGEERLLSVIGHEMAHVARRDYLTNLICELALIPISFHPLAFVIKRQIDRTRELSCDELVSRKLLPPKLYARTLVWAADLSSQARTDAEYVWRPKPGGKSDAIDPQTKNTQPSLIEGRHVADAVRTLRRGNSVVVVFFGRENGSARYIHTVDIGSNREQYQRASSPGRNDAGATSARGSSNPGSSISGSSNRGGSTE